MCVGVDGVNALAAIKALISCKQWEAKLIKSCVFLSTGPLKQLALVPHAHSRPEATYPHIAQQGVRSAVQTSARGARQLSIELHCTLTLSVPHLRASCFAFSLLLLISHLIKGVIFSFSVVDSIMS